MEEMQKFLSALCYEEPVFQLFYFLAINTGMRRGELCALRWSDVIVTGSYEGYIIVQHSRSTVSGEGVQEGKTKNGRARTVSMNEEMFSLLRGFCYRKMRLRDEKGIPFPEYIFTKRRQHAHPPGHVQQATESLVRGNRSAENLSPAHAPAFLRLDASARRRGQKYGRRPRRSWRYVVLGAHLLPSADAAQAGGCETHE